ncbi:DNA methyltransferase [Mycoplasma sp. 5912]
MNERLKLARELLKDDGVIFVSIDDNEQAYLKVLMDEIFGEINFVENFIFAKTGSNSGNIRKNAEYVICYVKDYNKFVFNDKINNPNESDSSLYSKDIPIKSIKFPVGLVYFKDFDNGIIYKGNYNNFELINDINVLENYNTNEFTLSGRSKWSQKELENRVNEGASFIVKQHRSLAIRYFEKHSRFIIPKLLEKDKTGTNIYSNNEMNDIGISFSYPKPSKLIKYLSNIHPNKNSRVLDFYAGSGTTGHAVLELNREDGGNRTFTLVTNNENSIGIDVTYQRLRRINTNTDLIGNEINCKWYQKNEPYNSNLNVYWLNEKEDYINIGLESSNNVKDLKEKWLSLIKNFGIDNSKFDYDELLTELLTLKPYKKND